MTGHSRPTAGTPTTPAYTTGISPHLLAVILLGVLSVVLFGCAEIVAPPGGEPDKTPPQLVESYPPSGETNVAADNKIRLTFSETLVRPTSDKAVFITPRPRQDPEIKFKGREIRISLAEFFSQDQTYVVTVNNSVADLRRNKLAEPTIVAFSTGEVIDTGAISGRVFDGNTPVSGALVGMWRIDSDSAELDYDSLYPNYTSTTNQEGAFSFLYLPAGLFRLVAFKDGNRNELLEWGEEAFAVPDRAIDIGGGLRLDSLRMTLTRSDTLPAEHRLGDLAARRTDSHPIEPRGACRVAQRAPQQSAAVDD